MIKLLTQNQCNYCSTANIENSDKIDFNWRKANIDQCWPKPYHNPGIKPNMIKAIVVGQDPTIINNRQIEYALEADQVRNLGRYLREIFSFLPSIIFNELYFTDLVKCRFNEKPGANQRNIYEFLFKMAQECFNRFLIEELRMHENARLIFTLGRDNFCLIAEFLNVKHGTLNKFKDYYGTPLLIPENMLGRISYLVPLPHQPTYNLAQKYSPYSPSNLKSKMKRLGERNLV